jgi:hypothetical protein
MSFTIELECGHGARILSSEDVSGKPPPEFDPWILYPLPPGDSIDLGDGMSCITCFTPGRVIAIFDDEQVAFLPNGTLTMR